ncbi:MAG: energy-coupling factor transporter transmembrane component T [Oscillospiraceae bacterium]
MKTVSNIHPAVLTFYFLEVILTAMFLSNPIIQSEALAGGILFSVMITNHREKSSDLRFYIPMFLLISITNPIFSHNGVTPLFFMNGNAVTFEAIVYGINLGIMIIGVMLWFKCLSINLTGEKIVYLFGRIIPKTALAITIAMRYIPMIKRESREVRRSGKAMGYYSSDSYFDKLRSSLRVMMITVSHSLERSVETSRAMKARGYGLKGHTSYEKYKFRTSDIIFFVVSLFLFVPVILGAVTGDTYFTCYPSISRLSISAPALIAYISFGILTFLPFAFELEELMRWKYCKSRI